MDVRNCKMCGSLFNYVDGPICPNCNKKLEAKFQDVKTYIRENPKAPLGKIAEENDVPVQQLKKWVRQERLSFSEDSGIMIDCEKCGKPIRMGRYCKACKEVMSNSFKGLYDSASPRGEKKKTQSSAGKMRFLN